MIRRPLWVATGVAIGVGGTLWAEQRVRRRLQQAADRLTPRHVADGARDSVRQLGARVRGAVEEGRDERDRTEAELWDGLDRRGPAAVPTGSPAPARRGSRHGSGRARR